jgi:hypothetical protein
MALPGLVAANNLSDVVDRERAWDNLGLNISYSLEGFEPEAINYINAVIAVDGQPLEGPILVAINNFISGCKADGIWPSIKASCILAGARTLNGALVPLVGTAPTNVGGLFVAGDYNRKTGLVGDGSTKYLNSNRNNNADPQNNKHISVYVSSDTAGVNEIYLSGEGGTTGSSNLGRSGSVRINCSTVSNAGVAGSTATTGFFGASRAISTSFNSIRNGTNTVFSVASETPPNVNMGIFTLIPFSGIPSLYSTARLAFYSIGESLDLALLDARVTDLINAFGAAIP